MTNNDSQRYQPEWALAGQALSDPEALLKNNFAVENPALQQEAFGVRDFTQDALIDSPINTEFDLGDVPYSSTPSNSFGSMQDFRYSAYELMMDVEFKSFTALT